VKVESADGTYSEQYTKSDFLDEEGYKTDPLLASPAKIKASGGASIYILEKSITAELPGGLKHFCKISNQESGTI